MIRLGRVSPDACNDDYVMGGSVPIIPLKISQRHASGKGDPRPMTTTDYDNSRHRFTSTGNQAGVRSVTRAGVRHVGTEGIVPGVPRTVAVAAVRCVAVTLCTATPHAGNGRMDRKPLVIRRCASRLDLGDVFRPAAVSLSLPKCLWLRC